MFPRTACKYSPMAAEKIAEMQKAQKIFVMSLAEELPGRNNVGVSLYLDYIDSGTRLKPCVYMSS